MLNTPKPDPTKDMMSPESRQRIYEFLNSHPIGVLATIDPGQNPHAVVVYYSVDRDFNLFFTTKRDTRKHDNLSHNNHVMLVAYDALPQTTVQVTGLAEDISDSPEANEIFTNTLRTATKTSGTGVPPVSRLNAGYYVVYRIKPVQIRMAAFMNPDSGGRDIHETIDFTP